MPDIAHLKINLRVGLLDARMRVGRLLVVEEGVEVAMV
jgi:hypothetical protein